MQTDIIDLKDICQQDIINYDKNTMQNIQQLVNQVIPEISNPTILDETEKQEQNDLEDILNKKTYEK